MSELRPLISITLVLASVGAYGLIACGDDDTTTGPVDDAGDSADVTSQGDATTGGDTGAEDAGADASDASDSGTFDRGPRTISFDGRPSGIYWDYGTQAALYIADEAHDRITKWTDQGAFSTYAAMPAWDAAAYDAAAGPPGLGQVVRLLDGTTVVTRVGAGSIGSVIVVDPHGDASVVPNLNPSRERVGLAILADGTLIDSYFTNLLDGGGGPADSGRAGSVAKLSLLAGTEKDMVTGLASPVGVVHNEGKVVISDQDLGLLLRTADGGFYTTDDAGAPEAGPDADAAATPPAVITTLAALASPDAICKGPDGSVFVGGPGVVYQVSRAGAVSTFVTGLNDVHGVAYDGAHTRLFVAEVDASSGAGSIHIYPVN